MTETAEVALIGAGPIGIELAVALKRTRVDYLHFDARQIGYTISWFAPQTRFFSSNERIAIAGVPLYTPDQTKATREQYLAYLRSIVEQFDLRVRAYEPVVDIRREREGFLLKTTRRGASKEYRVRKIVLATGGTERPRRLGIPGEDLPHVSHYFRDPHDYFQQRLLIIGGRNSAIEAALRSYHCGADVTISYRREHFDAASIKYWLMPELTGLIKSGKLKTHFQTRATEIKPGRTIVEGPEGRMEIENDFVLALIGYEADMTLCKLAGIELKGANQAPTFDPNTMQTNIPGVYLAGTAVGGTQEHYSIFLENCHVHADRIMASLTGHSPPPAPTPIERPES